VAVLAQGHAVYQYGIPGLHTFQGFGAQNGVKGPGADDVMPLGAQLGGHSQVFPIRPAGHGQCGDGAVHPGVQDILLRNEIVAAASASYRRAGLIGVEGQPLLFCHQNLTAGAAVPDRYGRGKDPLSGDAPVPLH